MFFFLLEQLAYEFRQDEALAWTNRAGDTALTTVEVRHDPDPTDTAYDAFFFIIRRKGTIRIAADRHPCGLFSHRTVVSLLRRAGFVPLYRKYRPAADALECSGHSGRARYPLFLCRKPVPETRSRRCL